MVTTLSTPFRPTTYAWIVLCAITILSWWLAPGHSGNDSAVPSVPITVAVVGLGVIKSRLIIRCFMEVHNAPRWLKLTTDAWLVALWLAILMTYLS